MQTNALSLQKLALEQLRKQFPEWTIRFVFGDHVYTAHRRTPKGRLNFKHRNPMAVVVALTKAELEHFPKPPAEPKQSEPTPCQNPGCPHSIDERSEDKCSTCGHGIVPFTS